MDLGHPGYICCTSQQNPTQGAVWEFRASCCMQRIVQHNTKVLPASGGRPGMVFPAAHWNREPWPLSMANFLNYDNSMACKCCLQFWSYLFFTCFGEFFIILQVKDITYDLDRGVLKQNNDSQKKQFILISAWLNFHHWCSWTSFLLLDTNMLPTMLLNIMPNSYS